MNPIEDGRFEQRAVDPAAAYGPAVLLAAVILFLAMFVGTESVAVSFGRQTNLGKNVGGIYLPFEGPVWELDCIGSRWPACRVPTRYQHAFMDPIVFRAWVGEARARRAATMAHFTMQHIAWSIGVVAAIIAAFVVGRINYRKLEAQPSKIHGSSEFATWEELRDAGYIAGVAPIAVKKP